MGGFPFRWRAPVFVDVLQTSITAHVLRGCAPDSKIHWKWIFNAAIKPLPAPVLPAGWRLEAAFKNS
jgi:hypothetical protein